MKKVIVPCDFSDQAIDAFRIALDVAQKSKGEVHLVNVIELPAMHDTALMPVLTYEQTLLNELRTKTNKQFKKLIAKHTVGKAKIVTKVLFGHVSHMIMDYVQEIDGDVIIMGTKGASGLREFVIGSNAEKIVRNSLVPVLTVKEYIKIRAIKNIVFPNTLDTESQEDLVLRVKALQDFLKASIHIVYINTPINFTPDRITIDRLFKFANRFMFKNFTINVFNDSTEESGVLNFAREIGADLIALGTHGRRGLARVFNDSIAENLVNHVDYPIWTYTIRPNQLVTDFESKELSLKSPNGS